MKQAKFYSKDLLNRDSVFQPKFSFLDLIQDYLFNVRFFSTHHFQPFLEDYLEKIKQTFNFFNIEPNAYIYLNLNSLRNAIVKLAESNRFYNGFIVNFYVFNNNDKISSYLYLEEVKDKEFASYTVENIKLIDLSADILELFAFQRHRLWSLLKRKYPNFYDFLLVDKENFISQTINSYLIFFKDKIFIFPKKFQDNLNNIESVLYKKILQNIQKKTRLKYDFKNVSWSELNKMEELILINDSDGVRNVKFFYKEEEKAEIAFLRRKGSEIAKFLNSFSFDIYYNS